MKPDHPRSRGVYEEEAHRLRIRAGSSPLARGLRDWCAVSGRGARIIPARAGFTPAPICSAPRTPDHPRSRGVYFSAAAGFSASTGSSPLARGLLRVGHIRRVVPRIIPARAGFTQSTGQNHHPGRDHPRSRGVYNGAAVLSPTIGGSSPLARGLPIAYQDCRYETGIIPARAGFTQNEATLAMWGGDHPPSRGVYSPSSSHCFVSRGSSPLARGLRRGPPRL